MVEDVIKEAIRLAIGGGVGLPIVLGIVLLAAILVVVGRYFGGRAPVGTVVPPDPAENPPSPPIVLRPDGSIPVSNPVIPPDPGPM